MLFNYIKIAFRNIVRHKVYSIINILGLAIGMACAILLLLFVRNEITYDRHNSKYKRIYMVQTHEITEGREHYLSTSPFPLAQALKNEYPVIEESVRMDYGDRIYFIDQHGEAISEEKIWYADPEIFKVFDHKFIYGSPDGALDAPNTIVLSETLSKKYFGEQNPVGKTISRKDGIDYIVKGVFEDLPHNSSYRYAALITFQNISESRDAESFNEISNSFINHLVHTYILLSENAEIKTITDDYKRFKEKYIAKSLNEKFDMDLIFQPLADVYLYESNDLIMGNNLQRVNIMSALALLILIIACINYMNLATARSSGRAKEVGIRKVLGADRASIIRQFLCESMIITITAMLISLVLIELFLPSFNKLLRKELIFSMIGEIDLLSGIIIVTLFAGLVAGSYPAFYQSSFVPAQVLRRDNKRGSERGILRKTLVIIQYAISITIIICTIMLISQFKYIQNKDLGYNKENVFFIPFPVEHLIPIFKENLVKCPGISGVSRSNILHGFSNLWFCQIEDSSGVWIDKTASFLVVDYDYIDLMEIKVIEGRSFNREIGSDQNEAILVNETFVKEVGWTDSPVGKNVKLPGMEKSCKVIGVLKDFNFQFLYEKVKPAFIKLGESNWTVNIKISPENSKETIKLIKEKWLELDPMHPIEIQSLKEYLKSAYRTEEAAGRILFYSAILSIFISCLGLFGLSSFIAENKTKEIGVRKVLGASVGSIVSRLSLNFLALVLIASIIACPIAYYITGRWLENFAYGIEMSWWLFAGAICLAMLIALATVSYHAVKAALTDPVKALRYE